MTKSISVLNATLPQIIASAESACPDGTVELSVANTFPTVTWSTGATENPISVGPGEYSVTTVDANGCSGEDNISITTLDLPIITIHAGRTTVQATDTTQLLASGGVTYAWDADQTLSAVNIANPIASPEETTLYRVTGIGENGCAGEATITITVSGTLGFPPAFSPNGDTDNEIWNIRAESTPDCTLTIYDGNGSKIFQKMGQNWDGTYQGKVVPSGTYYYVFSCPNEKAKAGSVLVFK
jgi:gliding motility-associated-like protein